MPVRTGDLRPFRFTHSAAQQAQAVENVVEVRRTTTPSHRSRIDCEPDSGRLAYVVNAVNHTKSLLDVEGGILTLVKIRTDSRHTDAHQDRPSPETARQG